jgi:hypothetical protein
MYPDALASVVHGCVELDKETDAKQIEHVKSTGATKKVVHTVSRSGHEHERVDNEMFEKLNEKLFPHHDHDEKKVADVKISYGAREFLMDNDFFE